MDIGLAFFVYKRPVHTMRVIESIRKNKFKKIYIFQDGLKEDRDRSSWEEVNGIIKREFPYAEIFVSEKNKGLANSIISGITLVLERHEMVIALEDDIVLSSSYLDYMKKCFEKYKDNKKVMCIAGGGWPCNTAQGNYEYDVYFSYRMSSAAWGTWKDRWKLYKRDFNAFNEILGSPKKMKVFRQAGSDLEIILQAQLLNKVDSWTIFWQLIQTLYEGVCILPTWPQAKDIGRDGGAGTNTTEKTTKYDTDIYEKMEFQLPNEIIINENIINELEELNAVDKSRTARIIENLYLLKKFIKLRGQSKLEPLQNWIALQRYGNAPKMRALSFTEMDVIVHGMIQANLNIENVSLNRKNFNAFKNGLDLIFGYIYQEDVNLLYQRKILEYYFAQQIILDSFNREDIYVDVGACSSPWVYYLREKKNIRAYGLDLDSSPFKKQYYIKGDATQTEFADSSIKGMSLQSSYCLFAGDADIKFIRECKRILAPGGKVVISPLYMHNNYVSAVSPKHYNKGYQDIDAVEYIRIDCLDIRMSRYYDVKHLKLRIIDEIERCGMKYKILVLPNEQIPPYDFPNIFAYLKFVLVIEK